MADGAEAPKTVRTAGEAGWHTSRYNLFARVPGTNRTVIANLFKGTCAEYSPIETHLLSVIERLSEKHPMIGPLARRGLIANFDERAALEMMGRAACTAPMGVRLTICPTMGCNFDCPYCFEGHRPGAMAPAVQDDVVALAGRMLSASGASALLVTWFGGEPLLAPGVIESLSGRLSALAGASGAEYRASIVTNGYLLTEGAAEMLGRCGVSSAQVTLDGVGAAHDATRHLAGGGPTFERILENISRPGLPFEIVLRQNVHAGNLDEVEKLGSLLRQVSARSGNTITHAPQLVFDYSEIRRCESPVNVLERSRAADLLLGSKRLPGSLRPIPCGAGNLWEVAIDPEGRLHKCWESVDKPQLSFGNAHDWDPADPVYSASNPDNLTRYVNGAAPQHHEECAACPWLPLCAGGCPNSRLTGQKDRACLPYKDRPEDYALARWRLQQLHKQVAEDAQEG